MLKTLSRFARDESGATATEYGLIIALIAVVVTAVLQGIGSNMNDKLTIVKDNLDLP